jgi:hypothetical protein
MEGILYIAIAVLLLGLVRMTTVFLHEISHALFALRYTKREVIEIFVGSVGETRKGLCVRIGKRLWVYIRFMPWKPYGGLCKYPQNSLTWQHEIKLLLAGNLTSLLVFVASAIFVAVNQHEFFKLLGNFFIVCTLIDLATNLISRKKSFTLYDSTSQRTDIDQMHKILTYNDITLSQAVKEVFKSSQNRAESIERATKESPKQETDTQTRPTVKGNRMSDN